MLVEIAVQYPQSVQLLAAALASSKIFGPRCFRIVSMYSIRKPMTRPASVMCPRNAGPIPVPWIHS